MVKVLSRLLSALFGAVVAFFTKDPLLAVIIIVPVILLAELISSRIRIKK